MYLIFLYCLLPVFLPYTVATAACEPSEPKQPPLRSASPPDWDRLSPSGGGLDGPAKPAGGGRLRPDLKPRSQGHVSGDRAGWIRGPAATSVTGESVKKRGDVGQATVCVAGQVESVTPGRVYVSGQLEVTRPIGGHQADSGEAVSPKATGLSLFIPVAAELKLRQRQLNFPSVQWNYFC